MMANNQCLPPALRPPIARAVSGSPLLDDRASGGLAVGKRARITWGSQALPDSPPARQGPNNLLPGCSTLHSRPGNSPFPERVGFLSWVAQLLEFLECVGD